MQRAADLELERSVCSLHRPLEKKKKKKQKKKEKKKKEEMSSLDWASKRSPSPSWEVRVHEISVFARQISRDLAKIQSFTQISHQTARRHSQN